MMLNRRDCFHNALRIPVTRCVSGSAFYARVLNLKLCVELFEKVQESSIHLDFLDPAQVLGVRYGHVENISAACRMHFATSREVSRAILSFLRILRRKGERKKDRESERERGGRERGGGENLAKPKSNLRAQRDFLFSSCLFSSPLLPPLLAPLLPLPLSRVESIKARTRDGVAETQFLQNFGPLRANFRLILFQID